MKVLITRTDRMGDVILSIPAVRHIRKVDPGAHVTFMVSSENYRLVEHEKDIDEVIVYDKRDLHKGFLDNFRFIRLLRSKKFDMAVILHPSKRVHMIVFASGIPQRIGYDRKWGSLLTKRKIHEKQLGDRHEVDYNLDMLSFAGFDTRGADRKPRIVVSDRSREKIEKRLWALGISGKIAAVHPGSSCPSKIWPKERFAAMGDILADKYSLKTVIVGDGSCREISSELVARMKCSPLDLSGELDLSELAALFERCSIVISNDSGPAHLAAGVAAPVVVIFGRNDPGLSPKRWEPVAENKKIIHLPPDCEPCRAHNCEKGFECLRNVTVSKVLKACEELLCP